MLASQTPTGPTTSCIPSSCFICPACHHVRGLPLQYPTSLPSPFPYTPARTCPPGTSPSLHIMHKRTHPYIQLFRTLKATCDLIHCPRRHFPPLPTPPTRQYFHKDAHCPAWFSKWKLSASSLIALCLSTRPALICHISKLPDTNHTNPDTNTGLHARHHSWSRAKQPSDLTALQSAGIDLEYPGCGCKYLTMQQGLCWIEPLRLLCLWESTTSCQDATR